MGYRKTSIRLALITVGQWNWILHHLNEVICKPTPLLCSYYALAPRLGENEPYSKAPAHLISVVPNSCFEVKFSASDSMLNVRQYVKFQMFCAILVFCWDNHTFEPEKNVYKKNS